jgi:hypothetical protein
MARALLGLKSMSEKTCSLGRAESFPHLVPIATNFDHDHKENRTVRNKLGIVLALVFVLSFGTLAFAQNTNSSTTTTNTTTSTTHSRRHGRRHSRRHGRRHSRHSSKTGGGNMSGGNMGNGNANR